MDKSISFTIPIVPVGQRRARACVRGRHAAVYKDKVQELAENVLMTCLAACRPKEPLRGSLRLTIRAFLPVPASKPKRWKAQALNGFIGPTTKPDLDNMVKHLCDCLTQMRFFEDDRQIVQLDAVKMYSAEPRWEVEITEVAE